MFSIDLLFHPLVFTLWSWLMGCLSASVCTRFLHTFLLHVNIAALVDIIPIPCACICIIMTVVPSVPFCVCWTFKCYHLTTASNSCYNMTHYSSVHLAKFHIPVLVNILGWHIRSIQLLKFPFVVLTIFWVGNIKEWIAINSKTSNFITVSLYLCFDYKKNNSDVLMM